MARRNLVASELRKEIEKGISDPVLKLQYLTLLAQVEGRRKGLVVDPKVVHRDRGKPREIGKPDPPEFKPELFQS